MANRGPSSRSEVLGNPGVAEVAAGRIHYREVGEGPTLVFVAGFAVNGDLWREVVPRLSDRYRCVTVELPTGAHAEPVDPTWPLGAPGMGQILADVLDALDLSDVTIVANDSGCAHTQALITSRPDRVARVVFTAGEFFDHFPPPLFKPLQWMGRVRVLARLSFVPMRWRWGRNLPIAFGWTQHGPLPDDLAASFLAPAARDPDVFEDLRRHIVAFDRRDTNAFAERFPDFGKPVLLAWGADDKFFPLADAQRAADLFPDARVEVVAGSRTFMPLDQPEPLATLIDEFVSKS